MNWAQFAVQWLHVLLGIVWFGYALTMAFLVSPPLMTLGADARRDAFWRLGERGSRVMPFVAVSVLVLGVVRGTVLGPIRDVETLFTAYGITWLVALVTTVALFLTGALLIGPAMAAVRDATDLDRAMARVRTVTQIDLALFFVVFTCMILMRFGI